MPLRFVLVLMFTSICSWASGTSVYNQNGNFSSLPSGCPNCSLYNSSVADWTEDVNTSGSQQIVCIVALGNASKVCGNPGPDNAASISVYSQSTSGLPSGTNNYLIVDGNIQYGAPVSTDLTGLTIGNSYILTFYQSSNQETPIDRASNDSWEVFLINGAGNGTSSPSNPAFTSAVMVNSGATSTPWEQQSYSFVATAASQTLEFLANVTGTNPPLLGLADVSVTDAPEAGTWSTTLLGGLIVFFALWRRRFSRA